MHGESKYNHVFSPCRYQSKFEVMRLTSMLVPELSDTQTWLELGKYLKTPENELAYVSDMVPDPALRVNHVYWWHFANWIVSALVAINEGQLAAQLRQG